MPDEGRPQARQFRLGGNRSRALSRAAALSAFHLWQTLAKKVSIEAH
jgi:hypothetical protein